MDESTGNSVISVIIFRSVCNFRTGCLRQDLLSSSRIFHRMTRGNQRELARAKNLKKQQEQAKKKGSESGGALKERKERDAAMMREKQKKAEERQAAAGGAKK